MKTGLPVYSRKESQFAGPVNIYSGPTARIRRDDALDILALNDAGAGVAGITGFGTGAATFTRATTAWTYTRDNQYLRCPGTSANGASTPDSVATSVLGDIDVRVRIAADDYTPGADQDIVSKDGGAGQRSWTLRLLAAGTIQLLVSLNGTATTGTASSVATGVTDLAYIYLKATRSAATGAINYYTSTDGIAYNQLGTADVASTAGALFDSTAPIWISGTALGTANMFSGKAALFELRNVIGGGASSVVAKFDPRNDATYRATTWTSKSPTAEVWTLQQTLPNPATLVQAELVSVASGSPRSYYDYVGGAYLGYMPETARTNLCLQARDLSNASWIKVNTTAAKDQFGIDGVPNAASSLTCTVNGGTCLQTITEAATDSLYSLFIKRLVGTGTVTIQQGATTLDVTAQLNTGYYTRVTLEATVLNPAIGIIMGTAGDKVAVDVNQFENGATASTPILTTTLSVARNADVLGYTPTGFPNSAAGTLLVEYTPIVADTTQKCAISLDDGTDNERHIVDTTATPPVMRSITVDGGVTQCTISSAALTVGVTAKTAFAWNTNDFAASTNGAAVGTDAGGTLPTVTTLNIGHSHGGIQFNGPIKSARWFGPRRLSNSRLLALSAPSA